jgi:uncharacterized protein (DUF427 family)
MATRREARPAPDLGYFPVERRVRARLGGDDVADTNKPLLVWEPNRPVPLYVFPRDDVRFERLSRSQTTPPRNHPVAEAWDVDGAEAAAWAYDDPDLAGHVALDWNAMDAWFEEDDEVFVHARDPFKRVEVRASSRAVRIEAGGSLLAESSRPLLLFETGLPTRYYLPPEDVRMELLEPTDTRSKCPYKGEASYWSARAGERLRDDIAWSYPDPIAELPRVRDLIAFFNERVDMTVDGVRQERPQTPWSRDDED